MLIINRDLPTTDENRKFNRQQERISSFSLADNRHGNEIFTDNRQNRSCQSRQFIHQWLMQGADWLPICYSVSGLNIFLNRTFSWRKPYFCNSTGFIHVTTNETAIKYSRRSSALGPWQLGTALHEKRKWRVCYHLLTQNALSEKLRISEVKGFSNSSLVSQFGYFFNSQNFYPERMRVVCQLKL